MKKKQLVPIFLCSCIIWSLGNGLLPLLPIYAKQLGASATIIGYYLAISYAALAAGTLSAGWLADLFKSRKLLLIIAGFINVFVLFFLGYFLKIKYLIILTSVIWFLGGLSIALLWTITGMYADKNERGKIFGLLALTSGIGSIIGGLTFGNFADLYGFQTLFKLLSVFAAICPIITFLIDDKKVKSVLWNESSSINRSLKFGKCFLLLIIVGFLGGFVFLLGRLGISLAMNIRGFKLIEISLTTAVGGLVSLPFIYMIGWLADKFGKIKLLSVCFILGTTSMIVLIHSSVFYHFIIASAILILLSISQNIGAAFVTDLVPKQKLGKSISIYTASNWLGGIIGFALGGIVIQNFGLTYAFILCAIIPIFALLFLSKIQFSFPEK
ncbi:MAG: MFS transporter [Armatimonadetes bacterium]|nr:MFS transporter [Armatimonadota bacterium]